MRKTKPLHSLSFKPLLLLVFLITTLTLTAQIYHPMLKPNKFWDVMAFNGSEMCGVSSGQQCFLQGDTVISGNQYQIIKSHPIISLVNPGPYCPPFAVDTSYSVITGFIREDSIAKKVFVYDISNNVDDLLYDFNLVVGDTLNSNYAGQGLLIIIDSIDTFVLLNNQVRKRFYYTDFFGFASYYVEELGLPRFHYPLVGGLSGGNFVTCVKENNIQLYNSQWAYSCPSLVGIEENNLQNAVKISPNPTRDNIVVAQLTNFVGGTIKIINLMGQVIFSQSIQNQQMSFNLSAYSKGIYLVKISSDKQQIIKKIMLE
ncbi:MAG: T9SS type A sorting domain-containing protein [Vicingaceae bacterium]|nr:T9SS type A sorting domain-containing protein [Vicingaceae bacterium]